MIASFGPKVFEVSSQTVKTFTDLSISGKLRTETKEVKDKKPTTTIKGPGLTDLSFSVTLDARYNNIRAEIDSWEKIRDAGTPYLFVLGNKAISSNKFLLTDVQTGYEQIDNRGNTGRAILSLKLTEYVQPPVAKKSSKRRTNPAAKPVVYRGPGDNVGGPYMGIWYNKVDNSGGGIAGGGLNGGTAGTSDTLLPVPERIPNFMEGDDFSKVKQLTPDGKNGGGSW